MSYIPDCRTDEYYNQKYLVGKDKDFIAGFDFAVHCALNLFSGNEDVYEELYVLLYGHHPRDDDDEHTENSDIIVECLKDWLESDRNEMITSIIDDMGKDKYKAVKEKIDKGEKI